METTLIIFSIIVSVAILAVVALFFNIEQIRNKEKKVDFRSLSMQFLAVTVWIALLANIFLPEHSFTENTKIGLLIFMTSIVVGIFLIRSIFREIETEGTVDKLIDKLHANNKELRKLDEQKTEFVSIASHQLRGPLSSILGHISMILEGDYGQVPESLKEPMNRVFKSSSSLGILINDFLNVSRIEKGEMEYLIEDFNASKVLETVYNEFTILAAERQLYLRNNCLGKDIMVRGDIVKARQIISNLLDNAIKYTKKGGVTVDCDINKDEVIISIKDTGIGMSKETLSEVFKKFTRSEEAIKMEVSGTGLGLFVASVMADAMGGKVWAESEGENKGSVFFIKLPTVKD